MRDHFIFNHFNQVDSAFPPFFSFCKLIREFAKKRKRYQRSNLWHCFSFFRFFRFFLSFRLAIRTTFQPGQFFNQVARKRNTIRKKMRQKTFFFSSFRIPSEPRRAKIFACQVSEAAFLTFEYFCDFLCVGCSGVASTLF